jgi:small conductance mechanosensitive channel
MPEEHVAGTLREGLRQWYLAMRSLMSGDLGPLGMAAEEDLLPAATALLALFVAYFFGKYVARLVEGPICRRVDETLGKFAGKLLFYLVMTIALVSLLGSVGISTASFAAVLTATGFAIGLAFQGTLSNFASGILLMVFRPFKVGDLVVVANGMTGIVNEIDLFTTKIDTPDNRRIIVPNNAVTGNTIENVTYHPHRRIEIPVGIAYDASLDNTRRALVLAAEQLLDITIPGESRGYQIVIQHFGASSIEWLVRLWVPTDRWHEAKQRLIQAIKLQLDAHNLRIPFPQMDIHLADRQPEGELGKDASPPRLRPRARNHAA